MIEQSTMTPRGRKGPAARAARGGFTLIEVSIAITVIVFSLMAMSASTLRTHGLRKQNRERAVAQNAIRMLSESIHALSQDALREVDGVPWSQRVVNELTAAENEDGIGSTFDIRELNAPPNVPSVGTIRIITDETMTDAQLGVDIGMPRDLNGDGDAADTNVTGTARLHPVIVSVTWRGPSGPQTITQPFYIVGY